MEKKLTFVLNNLPPGASEEQVRKMLTDIQPTLSKADIKLSIAAVKIQPPKDASAKSTRGSVEFQGDIKTAVALLTIAGGHGLKLDNRTIGMTFDDAFVKGNSDFINTVMQTLKGSGSPTVTPVTAPAVPAKPKDLNVFAQARNPETGGHPFQIELRKDEELAERDIVIALNGGFFMNLEVFGADGIFTKYLHVGSVSLKIKSARVVATLVETPLTKKRTDIRFTLGTPSTSGLPQHSSMIWKN